MPNYFWSITLLLILAVLSCHAAGPAPPFCHLPQADKLLFTSWEAAAQDYAAQVFQLITGRISAWRSRGGYGDIGIYVQELHTGFTAGRDAERTQLDTLGEYSGYYHTASVAKLLISYAFYWLDDQGQVDIAATVYDQVTGQSYPLQPTIHRMLTHSVNLYHNVLLRQLGPQLATDTLVKLGLPDSRLSRELGWAPGTSDAT